MTITATCPKCGKSGTAPREAMGRTATCKGCGTKFVVADAAERPAAKLAVKAAEVAPARSPVAVVGDPTHEVEKVVQLLNKRGIPTGKLGEGPTIQPVVVAGHDGPTEKIREAVGELANQAVSILGIVYATVEDDESLHYLKAIRTNAEADLKFVVNSAS